VEINVFGFNIKRQKDAEKPIPSVVSPDSQDGAVVVGADGANYYGYAYNPLGEVKTELDLLRRYREVAAFPEVDQAINDIVDEAIVFDDEKFPVELDLEETKFPESIKKKFNAEFEEILHLLEFDTKGYDIFRQWYVDGKLYYHILFENDNFKNGIAEVRYIDPRKIKKIRNVKKKKLPNGVEVTDTIDEYYLYNDKGIDEKTTQGVKLTPDSVVCAPSGLIDQNNGLVLSHLQKAIKAANQLKMVEDALVIYRLTRAPERRIFYIDVGNLPKGKAEQYVNEMMNKFRNKLVYDASTGELADSKRHLSMMEDFWMPRREGGKGTEITTLPGGQNLAQIEDVEYFKNKLMRALNVPIGRMQPEQNFSLGRSNEISRDELKFKKFIDRLRSRFNTLFIELLKVQLVAKGIIKIEEWEEIKSKLVIKYHRDNQYSELKELELMQNRLGALQQIDPYLGKYYSKKWIQKHVLRLSEDEIEEMDEEVADDLKNLPELQSDEESSKPIPQPKDKQ
jgi:hypothetical protein